MGRTKIKSAYCRICGAQRKFTKERSNHTGHLVASKLSGGLWLPVYALAGGASALKKYRCDTCGSVEGARPPRPPMTAARFGKLLLWAVGTFIVILAIAVGAR